MSYSVGVEVICGYFLFFIRGLSRYYKMDYSRKVVVYVAIARFFCIDFRFLVGERIVLSE